MSKKLLKTFLILGIFSLFIFNASFCLALDAPVLTLPADGAIDQEWVVWLEWNTVTNADTYEIRYVKVENEHILCKVIKEVVWTESSFHPSEGEYTLTGLQPSTRYCWKIKAESDKHEDKWSNDIYSFTTKKMSLPPGPPGNGNGPIELINPLNAETLDEFLNTLINFLFYLAIAIVPLMAIYSAYLMLFSGGDAKKVEKGKQIIFWSLVALVIILFAKGLPAIIISL